MIRRLTAEDHQQVQDFLQQLPTFALFLTADIEKYGYESSVFTIWEYSVTPRSYCMFSANIIIPWLFIVILIIIRRRSLCFLSDQAIKYDT